MTKGKQEEFQLPPKQQPLPIRKIILKIKEEGLNTYEEKVKFLSRFKYIQTDYTSIYNIIINNDLNDNNIEEVRILNQMLHIIGEQEEKGYSIKKRDEKVGQVLVNEIVMPRVREEKRKKRNK